MSVRKISDSLMIECIMRHCLQILKKIKSMNEIRLFRRIKRRLVFKNMTEITHNIVILIKFLFLLGKSLNRKHNAYKLCGPNYCRFEIFSKLWIQKKNFELLTTSYRIYVSSFSCLQLLTPKYVATSKKEKGNPLQSLHI